MLTVVLTCTIVGHDDISIDDPIAPALSKASVDSGFIL